MLSFLRFFFQSSFLILGILCSTIAHASDEQVSAFFALNWSGSQTVECKDFFKDVNLGRDQLDSLVGIDELKKQTEVEIQRGFTSSFCNDYAYSRKIPTIDSVIKIWTLTGTREALSPLIAKVNGVAFQGLEINTKFIAGYIGNIQSSLTINISTSIGSYSSPIMLQTEYKNDSFSSTSPRCQFMRQYLAAMSGSCSVTFLQDLKKFVLDTHPEVWSEILKIVPAKSNGYDQYFVTATDKIIPASLEFPELEVNNSWQYPQWWPIDHK